MRSGLKSLFPPVSEYIVRFNSKIGSELIIDFTEAVAVDVYVGSYIDVHVYVVYMFM